ncbi:MAG: TlpA disulfide reductase family protein [Bryobacterales bacterium]|nr:TlpA family protein disulfide reductase [Bryobacteraceae bacterium]MDW8355289.1 TlpA disulfide reductase family protein [Bryobacterales bacterium]
MKRLAFVGLVAAATGAATARLAPLDEKIYRQVLASYRGQVVLVDFWATWCAPCLEELPQLVKLEAKYRSRGLRLVPVSCDEPEDEGKALAFLRKAGVSFPGYLKRVADDEKFIVSVDPKWSGALPALFLYDRRGRLVRSFVGEADLNEVEKAVVKLL